MELKNSEQKKSKGWYTIVAETYKDFAENTSIHGLKYTVNEQTTKREKVFWIIVVLIGTCGAAYMTVLFLQRYLSNPTRTTILSNYLPTTTVPFPAVTICNNNRILVSKVEELLTTLNLTDAERVTLRDAVPQLLALNHPNTIAYNTTELGQLQAALERNGMLDVSPIMQRLSQRCDEMLIRCSWNNKMVDCSEYFKQSLTAEGYCCSFNYLTGDDLYYGYNGIGSGLFVVMDPQSQAKQYSSYYSTGFKVLIHDQNEFPGAQTTSRIVSTGRISSLQISGIRLKCSKEVKLLSVTQRSCLQPDEKQLMYSTGSYSSANCLTECKASTYYDTCECVPYYYTFVGKPICNISSIPCLRNVKIGQSVTDTNVHCNCLAQCEDDFYTVVSTSATYEPRKTSLIEEFETTTTKEMAFLNIFFQRQTQKVYLRDVITSTVYLLSSVGGVYSVFIGCSLITIFEIIYYCFFRFVVNMKLIGKVNVSVDDVKKINVQRTRDEYYDKFSTDRNTFKIRYNYNVFIP